MTTHELEGGISREIVNIGNGYIKKYHKLSLRDCSSKNDEPYVYFQNMVELTRYQLATEEERKLFGEIDLNRSNFECITMKKYSVPIEFFSTRLLCKKVYPCVDADYSITQFAIALINREPTLEEIQVIRKTSRRLDKMKKRFQLYDIHYGNWGATLDENGYITDIRLIDFGL